jgi:hypothetical protein
MRPLFSESTQADKEKESNTLEEMLSTNFDLHAMRYVISLP